MGGGEESSVGESSRRVEGGRNEGKLGNDA